MKEPPCPSNARGGAQDEPLTGDWYASIASELDGHPIDLFFDGGDLCLSSVQICGCHFEPESFSYREIERFQREILAARDDS